MKWEGRRKSSNVEDRRGMSGGGKAALGGGSLLIIGIIIFSLFTGKDPSQLMGILENQMEQQAPAQQSQLPLSAEDKKTSEFIETILADTEDVWEQVFKENGLSYKHPKLVLFTGSVQTACGGANAAVGPFYCPSDQKVYMDMSFFEELQSKFGAKGGDFAVAYVVAHEIGHHVQNLLGTSNKVHQAQQRMNERDANKLSVALELQADFYAGVWAHYDEKINQVLEEGDIEEAMSAAQAVGDDAIQKRIQGQVVPDAFTHGTSAQRMFWFKKGLTTGDMRQGDTFSEILK